MNGEAIDYDAYGDITQLGNSQFSFNDAKELTQATGTNPQGQAYQINYTYDGNGNRIESDEITPTVQNIIEVRANNHLLFEKNLTNNTETDYYYLNNQLVASNTHPTGQTGTLNDATYYADDIIGTPLLATTSNQSLKSQSVYYPYGNLYSQSPANSETNPSIGFAGKVHEANTGLSYSGARYYDPTLGRFISTDPVGFSAKNPLTFNRYDYADNNPYRYIDPTGDFGESINWDNVDENLGNDFSALFPEVSGAERLGLDMIGWGADAVRWGSGVVKGLDTDFAEQRGSQLVIKNGIRGRSSEARVLKDLGLSKNTQRVNSLEGNSIPDALTDNLSIEIKDAKNVSLTRQLRIQTEAARASGRQSILITGENSCISGPCLRAFDQIIRRTDLGG